MSARRGFVDALLAAPIGVAWLGLLEGEVRDDTGQWMFPADSERDAVSAAADAVHARSLGSLLALAVNAGYVQVGPWMPSAAATAAAAYRHADDRAVIAEAIDERFGDELHQPVDVDAQEWWNNDGPVEGWGEQKFRSFGSVYGAGQFTWAGLWTVTRPPEDAHSELVGGWEMDWSPVSRWRLPVRPDVRVVELHRPQDWVALVNTYPALARPEEEGWELPGRNQDPAALTALMSLPGQRAARTSIRRHLVPDWSRVAGECDGVHLSWAGFITSEGCVSDLGDGDVAMLRYWFSEHTLWLADVFGEPQPLAAPDFDTDGTNLEGIDVRADSARRRRDQAMLAAQLNR